MSEILAIFKKVYEKHMRWDVFDEFWSEEKKRGNLYGLAIANYDLENHKAIINLGNGDPSDSRNIEIAIDRPLTHSINNFYLKRKRALEKAQRTKEAMKGVALKLGPKKTV